MTTISVTSTNQWYGFLKIPLVRHSGAFIDWLKFVLDVTYHYCLLLFHFFFFFFFNIKDHLSDKIRSLILYNKNLSKEESPKV